MIGKLLARAVTVLACLAITGGLARAVAASPPAAPTPQGGGGDPPKPPPPRRRETRETRGTRTHCDQERTMIGKLLARAVTVRACLAITGGLARGVAAPPPAAPTPEGDISGTVADS